MNKKTVGFKIGVRLAVLHFCFVMLCFFAALMSRSSTGGLIFLWFYFLDAPTLFLFPFSVLVELLDLLAPVVQFGIFGSALWFLIPWLIDKAFTTIFPNGTRTMSVFIIIVAIPFVLAGFSRLSLLSAKRSMQERRPEELKNKLNSISSNFLTQKTIFEDSASFQVNSITRMNCRPEVGAELILGLTRGVAFLNKSYQEQHRIKFSQQMWLPSVEPVVMDRDHHICGIVAYMFHEKSVHLFDINGNEIWRYAQGGNAGGIDGVSFGDIDGDGKTEFAIYYSYREGIHLLDGDGKIKWKRPIYSLGHLEIVDIDGDGKMEIIYTNSNNANGITNFTILDSRGVVIKQWSVPTESYEFAVVGWPKRQAKPNFLLTEKGTIRLVDLDGNGVAGLNAPGSRAFGDVKSVTVKFHKEKSEYLAVKKSLHPDLSVLYVYDADGKLVYQKTDVIEGVLIPTLAAVPADETGAERLLVGGEEDSKAKVFEYSLTGANP